MRRNIDEWLADLAAEFRSQSIPQRQRPLKAIERYSEEFQCSVDISSPVAKSIFRFFENRAKPETHQVGSLYSSVYLYDMEFWALHIPITYGTVSLEPTNSLEDMPDAVKLSLTADRSSFEEYAMHWARCVDYGYGVGEMPGPKQLNEFGLALFAAADQEIRSTNSMILDAKARDRALLSCRMATEKFLKSMLALEGRLTRSEAINLSHNLTAALDALLENPPNASLERIRPILETYPGVSARYEKITSDAHQLWKYISVAQELATEICHRYTDRNCAAQIAGQVNAT